MTLNVGCKSMNKQHILEKNKNRTYMLILFLEGLHYQTIYILTWPPCIASVINITRWSSLTEAESSNVLGTVPIGLRTTLYIIRQTSA